MTMHHLTCSRLPSATQLAGRRCRLRRTSHTHTHTRTHAVQVLKAVADGHDVRGAYWWTLMDNIEWHEGFHIKFGLYAWDPGFADKYKGERRGLGGRWGGGSVKSELLQPGRSMELLLYISQSMPMGGFWDHVWQGCNRLCCCMHTLQTHTTGRRVGCSCGREPRRCRRCTAPGPTT